MFTKKTLLITGGTGSFGNAVLDKFLDTNIGEIRIFSRDEKKQTMRKRIKMIKSNFTFSENVRDIAKCEKCAHGVDFIFHARA